MLQIRLNGLYLSRTARQVGIIRDRGPGEFWRWVTNRNYYVRNNGLASRSGVTSVDLVQEVGPTAEECAHADSMWGVIPGTQTTP